MNVSGDPGFEALTRVIADRGALCPASYKPRCLQRRIAVRMRARGVDRYEDYLKILEGDPAEYQKLADTLTINVTNFFRNPELWDRLRTDLLAGLLERRPLRIWSAGCASGEEPYSLVMAIAEVAERIGRPAALEEVTIDATDIDRASLERAAAAIYPVSLFKDAPPALVERYTEPDHGQRRIRERLRRRVRVARLDLHRDPPAAAPYDMIICRNVLIYFDRAGQDRIFAAFADALAPGGLLVLGKVETILGPIRERFEIVDVRERIYRLAE